MTHLRVLFLDFDGVIKESLDVKTRAFGEIFAPWGSEVMARARKHHIVNGGMSRYKKIPLYLREYCGVEPTEKMVQDLLDDFASRVIDEVIASPFVAGALDLIRQTHAAGIPMAIVTGTPQPEMEMIAKACDLTKYFARIYGSPRDKHELLAIACPELGVKGSECVFVGDAINDWQPAHDLGIPFVGRLRPGEGDPFPAGTYRIKDFTGMDAATLYAGALSGKQA
jgi:HAD superfamily hydrolase (TIGR01509 family)